MDDKGRRQGRYVACFVRDVTEQRRLEREVLEISEDERRRLGRDLHDGLGQQLTALLMMSRSLARELQRDRPELASHAEELAEATRQAAGQTRRLAHGLSLAGVEAGGLMAALNDLSILTTQAGLPCAFSCDAPVVVHDLAIATHLLRIAQEAVNNAMRHSGAARVTLRLASIDGALELKIQDDGCGLPMLPCGRRGMGLEVMEYRARLIGARLCIDSEPGAGVRITCTVPEQR